MTLTGDRLPDTCVEHTATIREALLRLERGGTEIVLVLSDAQRLEGILTDGDLRRALLSGAGLDSPVAPFIVRDCLTVAPNTSRAEVLELMQSRRIGQVPIVDAERRLWGLHLLHDMLGTTARPNWAIIMCGGRGTRLGSLTQQTPKPMLRVAGRPILERIVMHLVGFGVRRIFLAVNYLAEQIEAHFGNGRRFGCDIDYLRETTELGTGGALSLLPERPTAPLLVMNGDLVTQFSVEAMLGFHERGGQRATMGVRRYFHTVPFGCVELDGDRISQFDEKPTLTRLVNSGIYVIDPGLLERVPAGVPYNMPQLLGTCLERNEPVRAFEIVDDWIDVGQRDQLKQARGETES